MANSQNGWPVVPRAAVDEAPLIRDVTVPNGVLAGDVATIFRWHAEQYDRRVERLRPGWCWGWYPKNIEGTRTISNHASGTAVDYNAPDNPMGSGTTKKSMTPGQIAECHRLEEESDHVLRWGGDYVSRNDPMHWEIVGSRAAVRALAARIRKDAEPVKEPTLRPLTVQVPALKQGDDDAKLGGYNVIVRIQRIVGAIDDGIWGPDTTARIAAWCRVAPAQARTLTDDLVKKIFGLQ